MQAHPAQPLEETTPNGLKVRSVDISAIRPYEHNPKIHSDQQIGAVAESIREFGWMQPLVIDRDNNLVVGHCRLEAAKRLGHTTAPAVVAEDLTPEQIRAYRVADNKLAEMAKWISSYCPPRSPS